MDKSVPGCCFQTHFLSSLLEFTVSGNILRNLSCIRLRVDKIVKEISCEASEESSVLVQTDLLIVLQLGQIFPKFHASHKRLSFHQASHLPWISGYKSKGRVSCSRKGALSLCVYFYQGKTTSFPIILFTGRADSLGPKWNSANANALQPIWAW